MQSASGGASVRTASWAAGTAPTGAAATPPAPAATAEPVRLPQRPLAPNFMQGKGGYSWRVSQSVDRLFILGLEGVDEAGVAALAPNARVLTAAAAVDTSHRGPGTQSVN